MRSMPFNRFSMTEQVVERGLLQEQPFVLIDVGASGGIHSKWHVFGNCLRAYAFEPLLEECTRLNNDGARNIEYLPYFVGGSAGRPKTMLDPGESFRNPDTPLGRSSALRAEKILRQTSIERINRGKELRFSDQWISLDRFVKERGFGAADIDFIKIDTDGSDYEVLEGSTELLQQSAVLGIALEVNFQPVPEAESITFAEIDAFCRKRGFSLFDLRPYRYSRGTLPSLFSYDFPAQSIQGQVVWGDALYLRDQCVMDSKNHPGKLSKAKLVKLACVYELHDLPDCAAELIETHRNEFDEWTDNHTDELLDALTPYLNGNACSFREYNELFEKRMSLFYHGELDLAQSRKDLQYVYSSKSWKLTKPLRQLRRILSGK